MEHEYNGESVSWSHIIHHAWCHVGGCLVHWTSTDSVNFHSSIGGLSWWRKWVWREGWLELRGSWGKGGVAGGRKRQFHDFTYGWMLWDRVGCVILDATNKGVMMQVRVHAKLLLIYANNTPAPHNMRKRGSEKKETQLHPSAWTNTQVSFLNY
jgi:hypothetical protein